MNVILTSPNHLLSRLLQTTPEAAAHLERVTLSPGPWPNPCTADDEGHVYFLEAGLMGLFWSGKPFTRTGMALLGCQACWWPGDGGVSSLQAQVLQVGHAQRIRWSVLQDQPQRYAPWLMQTAAASQQLIHQMAQLTFCAENHNRLQRLASGLLIVLNQNPDSDGQMSVADLAHWLSCPVADVQAASQTLEVHGALKLTVDTATGVQLHSLHPQMLASMACSCHLQVAQSHRANDPSQA